MIGLRFNWMTGPLVAIFLMAAAVSTLAALGRRDPGRVLADQPTDAGGEPAPGTVWRRLDWRSAGRATAIVVVAVAATAIAGPAPAATLVAGWNFSQYAGDGDLDTGAGAVDTLPANFSNRCTMTSQ